MFPIIEQILTNIIRKTSITQVDQYVPCPHLINFNPLKTKSNLDHI